MARIEYTVEHGPRGGSVVDGSGATVGGFLHDAGRANRRYVATLADGSAVGNHATEDDAVRAIVEQVQGAR